MKKYGFISALIMTAVLLAGCGGGNNSQTTTTAPAATTPAATETQSTATTQAAPETTVAAETPAAPESPAVTDQLSVEDAKRIAFVDAGANEIDVVLKKAALDTDEGVLEYEVEFFFNDTEYSYDIDPNTGMITDLGRELMDAEDYAEMDAIMNAGNNNASGAIDENKAFEIALAHANVSANDCYAQNVRLDYDSDYGKEVFEIEFKAGSMEYSYDIDPDTGNILDFEAEFDD